MHPEPQGFPRWERLVLWAALAALAARLYSGATSELMIDEVWSALRLERSDSVWQAVTVRHDNNHPLNTAAMYLSRDVGGAQHRWLSMASGILLVAAAWWREKQRGGAFFVLPGLLATALTLTMFSSEARGYMPMLLFAYVAWESLFATFGSDAGEASRRSALLAAAVLFVSCVLGFLAHFSFVFWLAGLGAAFALDVVRGRRRGQLATGAALLGAGIVVLVVYLEFIRSMELGSWGGGMNPFAAMLLSVAQMLGAYTSQTIGIALAVPALAYVALFVGRGHLVDDRQKVFFAVVIVAAPAIVLSVLEESRMPTLSPRYFVCSSFGFLMLFSQALKATFRSMPARALFLVYLASGTAASVALAVDGRGDYRGAVAFMASHSERASLTVSTDHDFRNWILLRHYRGLAHPKRLIYVPSGPGAARPTEWYLAHRIPGAPEAPGVVLHAGHRYERVASFGASAVIGFRCYLYRRTS